MDCVLDAVSLPRLLSSMSCFKHVAFGRSDITLMAPVLALLAEHPSEIGSRMGMCFTFTGIGSLIGGDITIMSILLRLS